MRHLFQDDVCRKPNEPSLRNWFGEFDEKNSSDIKRESSI
jgi:hypothetical protein